jgi:oligoendopeptidase F
MEDAYVKERERSRIPDRYKWDLRDIYPSDADWKTAKQAFVSGMGRISGFKGHLSESPEKLLACLETVYELRKEYVRLACYASMQSDLDTRDSTYMAMDQEMGQIGSDFSTLSSFIEPEILEIGPDTIAAFVDGSGGLKPYRHILDDILRKREHTGTEKEEKIISEAGLMADSPVSINNIFSNAEFPYLHRRSPVRENRRKAVTAFLGSLHEFRRTFGAQLSAEVRKNLFFSRVRNYGSCLERALNAHNIPVAVYKNLITGVHDNLDTLHRYLAIRKRLLGLETLHYYDLYAPVVKEIELHFSFDEAVEHVLASLRPLGPEYLDTAKSALSGRWIDVYHNHGKRSGAYSNGSVYDVHPYMLLNYNGKYDDVSTLTHELGHTMHSYLANKTQPYPLSGYSIFVAEIASTFNEALLLDHMLKTETRKDVRLALLCNHLDNARATVFRQTQFAEFELRMHETVESGTALTGDLLDTMYEEIVRRYHRHDSGICIIDDEIKSEWAYIPHFFYDFYVYQYATSFTASAALAGQVLSGETGARDRYLKLLESGGCDYPIELLKKVGLDMTTPKPLEATIAGMNRIMDEIEILAGS